MKKYTYVDENNNTTVAANYQDAAVKLYGQGKSHSGSITTYAKHHRGYAEVLVYKEGAKIGTCYGVQADDPVKHILKRA